MKSRNQSFGVQTMTEQQFTPRSERLTDLQERFAQLAAAIPESPQKEAISVLHAMIQEAWRSIGAGDGARGENRPGGLTLESIANLYKSAPGMTGTAVNTPLPEGSMAPDFTLPDANNAPVSLHDFRGSPVVLVFYPLDWSPTCSDQLSLYQAEMAEFERYGAKVVGISVDSLYSHGAWAAVRGLTFPLLADFHPKGEVSRLYHVYRDGDGFSERALYVIDAEGVIRYATVSPQLDHIPDIYELYGVLSRITGVGEPTVSETSQTSTQAAPEPVAVGSGR
jgi:peroxiredoxin